MGHMPNDHFGSSMQFTSMKGLLFFLKNALHVALTISLKFNG